jgi:hypothetical protein
MVRLRKGLLLLVLAGSVPAAALPFFPSSPHELCFTAGSVTYRLSPAVTSPDYRVRIDNSVVHPDLRVRLVDAAELADFALVDDIGESAGGACTTAGRLRTVKIVTGDAASDVTIAVSPEAEDADFTLFVHSARATHQDAAALFALMRRVQAPSKIAARH